MLYISSCIYQTHFFFIYFVKSALSKVLNCLRTVCHQNAPRRSITKHHLCFNQLFTLLRYNKSWTFALLIINKALVAMYLHFFAKRLARCFPSCKNVLNTHRANNEFFRGILNDFKHIVINVFEAFFNCLYHNWSISGNIKTNPSKLNFNTNYTFFF